MRNCAEGPKQKTGDLARGQCSQVALRRVISNASVNERDGKADKEAPAPMKDPKPEEDRNTTMLHGAEASVYGSTPPKSINKEGSQAHRPDDQSTRGENLLD